MKARVIINPYAGRWLSLHRKTEVENALQAAGIDYEIDTTNGPGHGIDLTISAVREGFSPIISAGGDGSINEVINGIMQAAGDNTPVPVGVMPLGTANDLVDNLGLPKDLDEAAKVIAAGKIRWMDLCQVNDRFFGNNSAIGLEPFITLIQQDISWSQGVFRYLIAALKGILANPQWTMHLEWEGGEYDGPATLVTVGNSPRTGGLFYMTPHANPFDGKLTFVYGYMATRLQILRLFPRTMKPGMGSYIEHPSIHEINSSWLKIRSNNPTPAHTDGEIISEAITDLEYRVIPGRLPILFPQADVIE